MQAKALASSITDQTPSKHELISLGLQRADALDFSKIKSKIRFEGKGLLAGCDLSLARVEKQYRQFLAMQFAYPEAAIVPTQAIDEFWHAHILDTRAYQRDCEAVFGYFLHHFPYFGINGPDDEANLMSAFAETRRLWVMHFGVDVGHSCDAPSICGGKCSSCSSCRS